VSFNDLIAECAHMPDAAVQFAQGVGWVKTPEDFMPLRDSVRENNQGQMEPATFATRSLSDRRVLPVSGLITTAGHPACPTALI
jgi:hypothetical protein